MATKLRSSAASLENLHCGSQGVHGASASAAGHLPAAYIHKCHKYTDIYVCIHREREREDRERERHTSV